MRATAEAIGLGSAIDAHLRLKVRDRGLSEAESILGMAEALAAGAKCLDDLEVARADRVQEELRGFGVPPPQTAGRFLRRFCLGHIGQLNKALRCVLLRALSLVGVGEAVTLDFDSTYIRSAPHAARERTRPTSSATPCIPWCASSRGSASACTPSFGGAAPTPPRACCPSSTSACGGSPEASR